MFCHKKNVAPLWNGAVSRDGTIIVAQIIAINDIITIVKTSGRQRLLCLSSHHFALCNAEEQCLL